MREILFKAKSVDSNEWVEGYYAQLGVGDNIKHYICQNMAVVKLFKDDSLNMCFTDVEIDPLTICQYTGLKDKNGKKIWENDVIKCGRNILVTWDDHFASWRLTSKGWLCEHFFGESQEPEDCEVIGNIFDNPDFLE